MNLIERQLRIGRELFELNTRTMQKLGEMTMADLSRYAEAGREAGERMREVTDPGAYLELQREYFQNLWSNAQQSMQERNDLLRQSMTEAGELIRSSAREDGE